MPPRHEKRTHFGGERFWVKAVFDLKNGVFGNEKTPWLFGIYRGLYSTYVEIIISHYP